MTLLRDFNDLLLSPESGISLCSLNFLQLLRLILLSRLESYVGIKDAALEWFQSYLSDNSFCLFRTVFIVCVPSVVEYLRVLYWLPFFSLYICFLWVPFLKSITSPFIVFKNNLSQRRTIMAGLPQTDQKQSRNYFICAATSFRWI